MNRLLKNCGCVCYEAEDGKECVEWMALAAANKSPEVDMVLMDYEMPCMIE
jgi:CheY-like chemotaxis protein